MPLRKLELTDEIARRVRDVQDALDAEAPERESADVVDIPKLRLADAVLAAIAEQSASRLARLPVSARPAVTPVVEVTLRPKRRRRA